jgi:hypothetical protein
MDLHAEIRRIAQRKHVAPALAANRKEFSISVRSLMDEAESEGISTVQRTPAFCKSIQTRGFLKENGITITRVDGPKSKSSTTVVVHYQAVGTKFLERKNAKEETPEERAYRLTEKIRGLMKDVIASHGGTEGYIRWVRSSDEDDR